METRRRVPQPHKAPWTRGEMTWKRKRSAMFQIVQCSKPPGDRYPCTMGLGSRRQGKESQALVDEAGRQAEGSWAGRESVGIARRDQHSKS